MNKRLEVIKSAVTKAGEEILKHNTESVETTQKSSLADFVTTADLASEKIIFETIKENFPDDIIISEETTENHKLLNNDSLARLNAWVTDPVDGTNNFKHGFGYSAVSLGYVENGIPVLAAVYNPYRKELYVAEKGKGATRNGEKISLSGKKNFDSNTRVATSNSYQNLMSENFNKILKLGHVWVDILGAVVLIITDTASGRIDIMYHSTLSPWDNAAAFLIAEEAGAKITDLNGKPTNWLSPEVVVGNPALVDEFVRLTN